MEPASGSIRTLLRASALITAVSLALLAPAEDSAAAACGKRAAGDGGRDRLAGSHGRDRISGRGGRDRLSGRGGRDCLRGGAGQDRLDGGAGRDKLSGGAGGDLMRTRDGARDLVACGRGRDRALVDDRDRVRGCESLGSGGGGARYVPKSQLGPVPADAYHVSPGGSDSNPGTATHPWRTLGRAIAGAGPGDTVVFSPGTYGGPGTTHTFGRAGASGAPITFRGNPGRPMPRILGHVRITGSYQRFNYLLFDGPTGRVKSPTSDNPGGEQVQITILGASVNGVEISDSEIRESRWHAGIYASTANGVRITGNYLHHNGDFSDPGQENQSHGIYFAGGSGLIANNVIVRNVARGIQLYGDPHDVVIANNTVMRNGKAGIQFASATSRSLAINNLVAYNDEYGIRSDSLTGNGNVVRQNLVWGNGRSDLTPSEGLNVFDNLRSHPGFGPKDDYRPPASSPAVDRAAGSYAPVRDFDAVPRPRGAAPDLGAFETG